MGLKLQPSHSIHGLPPKWACAICGTPFFEGEQRKYEAHCLTAHDEEELQRHALAAVPKGFRDDAGDVEWGEYIKRKAAVDPGGWARWAKTSDGKSSSGIGDG